MVTGNAIATVNAYYPDPDEMNIRYANAAGFYWNRDGSVVALDELNRRRAGYLYFGDPALPVCLVHSRPSIRGVRFFMMGGAASAPSD